MMDYDKIRELAIRFRGLPNDPDIKVFKDNGNYFLAKYWWSKKYFSGKDLEREDKRWFFTLDDIGINV